MFEVNDAADANYTEIRTLQNTQFWLKLGSMIYIFTASIFTLNEGLDGGLVFTIH